jgi:DNA methylase
VFATPRGPVDFRVVSTSISFEDWTTGRSVEHYGTNAGFSELPFQNWRNVKEAFAPEMVARAVRASSKRVRSCLDPFGGSGTTALACQFLGVVPTTIELNPYLADLTEAKLATYDVDALRREFRGILTRISANPDCEWSRWDCLPPTFIEPGHGGRWLFDLEMARLIGRFLDAIDGCRDTASRRFFRVIMSGTLVDASNAVVNGKGRRYRRNWAERRRDVTALLPRFRSDIDRAIGELDTYRDKASREYKLFRGDTRLLLKNVEPVDLVVFSPPYPNSFDYTDIYNIELWILGYLTSMDHNRTLRQATLPSHVQIGRRYSAPPNGSPILDEALEALRGAVDRLWSPWIPAMLGAYFASLDTLFQDLYAKLNGPGREVWMVVGDSRYAGVSIRTAAILSELAPKSGFKVTLRESSRSLRASAQQGGQPLLPETLLVLSRI